MELPSVAFEDEQGFRLVNSKYPPISLFDDVADPRSFDRLFAIQALTNPRIQNEVGNLNLITREEIPFGINGCSYAVAPFTHVNPDGSRFSDGSYGMLYMADTLETAIKEVSYHQHNYWKNIEGLKYDRFVMRGLSCSFDIGAGHDATMLPKTDPIYDPDSYAASRALGGVLKEVKSEALYYHSVRNENARCWGLFTPKGVRRIIQTAHHEFTWNQGQFSYIGTISAGL